MVLREVLRYLKLSASELICFSFLSTFLSFTLTAFILTSQVIRTAGNVIHGLPMQLVLVCICARTFI